jgi:hypothetical protein
MSWSTRRKLLYFFVFLIAAFLIIGAPLYVILHEKPNCFDNRQNQREEGVDCGGPCVRLCKPLELIPVVLWQQSFQVASGVYAATAYVQNPNLRAEAFEVPYKFMLYDTKNNLLGERTGIAYIPPGRNFAVFEGGIRIASGTPVRTEFEFDESLTWQLSTTKPDLKIQNLTIATSSSPTIEADIVNSTYADIPRVDVVAVIYDEAGNAFAASKTYIDYIDKQSKGHVTFTWPEPFKKIPVRIEIIPLIDERSSS